MNNKHITQRDSAFFAWISNALLHWILIFVSFGTLVQVFLFAQRNQFTLQSTILLAVTFFIVWFFIGSRQHALSILGHDGGHGLITQNLPVNDFLTRIFAFSPFGVSLKHYREFHFTHHQHLSTPLDPELALKSHAAPAYDLPTHGLKSVLSRSAKDMVGLGYKELIDILLHSASPVTLLEITHVLTWWVVVLSFVFYFNIPYAIPFLIFWFFCLGTSFWTCFRLRIYIEHLGTRGIHRVQPSRIAQFLFYPYNTWCHFEHHAFSSVSGSKLPKIRNQHAPEIPTIGVLDIYRLYANSSNIPSGTPMNEERVR